MPLCLVVAHETATSPELERALKERGDAFTLLVPATPGRDLLFPRKGRAYAIARQTAGAALARFEAAGLPVRGVKVGKAPPLEAIAEELQREDYGSILISTHPARVSRWLSIDLPGQARRFGLPVMHLVVRSVYSGLLDKDQTNPKPEV